MSEPTDIPRMREALKGNARFRALPEGHKAKLFQGMGKICEWLNDDVFAEDFSNRNSLKHDKSLIGPLKRILLILHAHREISIDLIDGLLRFEKTGSARSTQPPPWQNWTPSGAQPPGYSRSSSEPNRAVC